ncbi:hypothetical protein [Anaerosporobacter faecicola]|uniref:hypothetical protein n=1 Tax=Anaerosporobacter faecicola TaxID=2718714 RepID=UPI00143C1092|nr:hypothetical protein [Anaerosporobacter faecicola]
MDNSLKGLILAAGTIITCIVISLGFYISREARDTAASGAGQISKLNAEFNESDKVMYDGLNVSGSEVVNVINKFKNGDIAIMVNTKKSSIYYDNVLDDKQTEVIGTSSASVKSAQNTLSTAYINPNAQFLGSIVRDVNYTIIGITFTQVN